MLFFDVKYNLFPTSPNYGIFTKNLDRMSNKHTGRQRTNSKITVTHDGKKIVAIMKEKGVTPKEVVDVLEYSGKNAFSRFINEDSAIGLRGYADLSRLLKVEILDIVKDEYTGILTSFKIEHCNNENDLNKLLLNYEKTYGGRTGVFNSFPSMIYYKNDDQCRIDRFNFLNKNGVDNGEYYPLKSILEFGFGSFGKFSKEQKIEILDTIIAAHTGENKDENHTIYVIVDDDSFTYSPFAADCEILDRQVLIVAAPFYSYSVFLIKSHGIIEEITKHITRGSKEHIIEHRSSMKMLSLLLECLKSHGTIVDFITMLSDKNSGFYKPVLNALSLDLKESLLQNISNV